MKRKRGEGCFKGLYLYELYLSLLILLIGSSRGLLQSLNLYVIKTSSLGSYAMLIMPKP